MVASAAYRAGEKLHSEYYGEDSDYTNKGGVIYTEIFLPPHAPREYADRETLWNAVEKAEKGKKQSFSSIFQNNCFTKPRLKSAPFVNIIGKIKISCRPIKGMREIMYLYLFAEHIKE